jgi:CO/xanthine dehydrogenase Mo-binding subunit
VDFSRLECGKRVTGRTPSHSVKLGGEGGRMIAPAAIAAAVGDALAPLGVRVHELPLTPERIVTFVEAARR